MVVNVCPAQASKASPERFWAILMRPEAYGEWTDARFASSEPAGPVRPGTLITLKAWFGRDWPITLDVTDVDPNRRWIDLVARLPFGIENHEHLTLQPTDDGGTLVRFN